MKIILIEDDAFVDFGNYLLCIGKRQEILSASEQELLAFIRIAVVMAQYQAIDNQLQQTVH